MQLLSDIHQLKPVHGPRPLELVDEHWLDHHHISVSSNKQVFILTNCIIIIVIKSVCIEMI